MRKIIDWAGARLRRAGVAAGLGLCLASPAAAQPAPPPQAPAMTTPDLEAFFDGVMSQRLERDDVAGAAVVVVKDGQVLFEKGYGFADVKKRVPVTPDRTVFELASVSKTFTATAVMQLVEQGKLDLDADVQRYLDFKLRKRFPDPITLRRLLTHTAGFEEVFKDFQDLPGHHTPLGQYLSSHQPNQLFRPGTRIGYSNFGNSLAGYIVQRVSGEPYEAYVQRHIFAPLGMAHSSFAAALPPELEALQTRQYWVASQPPKRFDNMPLRPSGGLRSTPDDIGRFMIAQLQDGRYGQGRILGEPAARTLHTVQWRGNPQGPGIAIAFYQDVGNGRFVLAHGGDLCCQHGQIWLVPSEGTGVFVIINSAGKDFAHFRASIWKGFIDRYWPAAPRPADVSPTARADLAAVPGIYTTDRRADSNLFAITYALASFGRVTANPDGTASFSSVVDTAGKPKHFRPVAPLLFRSDDGHFLSFARDPDGVVRRLVVDSAGGFERRPGLFDAKTLQQAFLLSFFVLLATVLLWPVLAIARWRYKRPLAEDLDAPARRRRLLVKLAALDGAALVLGGIVYLQQSLAKLDATLFAARFDWILRLFQLLALVEVLGAAFAIWTTVQAWRRGEGSLVHRLGLSLTALALLVLALLLLRFNVLNPRLMY